MKDFYIAEAYIKSLLNFEHLNLSNLKCFGNRYSMFAQPKPILPGVEDEELSKASDESSPVKAITEGAVSDDTAKKSSADKNSTAGKTVTPQPPVAMVHPMAAAPKIETAWERGLRQAKEMKRRSQQRKVNYADFKFVCVIHTY